MKNKLSCIAVLAMMLVLLAVASGPVFAATVFQDDFTTDTGWTELYSNVSWGIDTANRILWGHDFAIQQTTGYTIAAGDGATLTVESTRPWAGYPYLYELVAFDGAATYTTIASFSGDLSVSPQTVFVAVDIGAYAGQELFLTVGHGTNWGETSNVQLDVVELINGAPQYITGVNGDNLILACHDEFNVDGQLSSADWSRVPRGGSNWNDTASDREDLVQVQNGNLTLHGIVNPDTASDPAPYLTGAVWTKNKVDFFAGHIQIRAKIESAQGAWPALWMFGYEGGERYAELDLFEHLNHDSYIYQTAHSDYTINGPTPNSPTRYVAPQADVSEYNIYSAEWDENSVTFMVNGVTTLVYPRMPEKGPSQYPWIDNPMYIILSMQIGGGWVGSAIPDQYPIKMDVDYVRVYSATPMAMDMISFANLAANWQQTGCGFCGGADLSGNGNVDVADLQVMAENWLADI